MAKYEHVWNSLRDEEYRREYSADVGTGLAFQIKLLRERNGWTQEHLAQRIGRQQETISQWENPNYGSYALKSLKALASAFDVALIVKFAPFSELVRWNTNLTPERLAPRSFSEEDQTRPFVLGSYPEQFSFVTDVASLDAAPALMGMDLITMPPGTFVATTGDIKLTQEAKSAPLAA